jgi:enterochelin esterase family protein
MRPPLAFRVLVLSALLAGCMAKATDPGANTGGAGGPSTSGGGSGGSRPAGGTGGIAGSAPPVVTTGGVGGPLPATGGAPGIGTDAGSDASRDAVGSDVVATDAAGNVGADSGIVDPGTAGDGDFMIGPTFTTAPEFTVRAGVPRGVTPMPMFTMSSTTTQIFPGVTGPYTRNVSVYIPSQYVAGTEAPFMVVQDGSSYVNTLVPVLNNMINDRRLPVMIAVFINPGPGDGTGSERGFEYDSVSDAYVRFIETEVLPRIQTDYNVRFTTNPEGRAAMGGSSGGSAAFTMGWFRPDLYRRILTYSGTFVNLGPTTMYPRSGWEYHEHLIAEAPAKPLRVALEVGDRDNGYMTPASGFRNWVIANQAMAAALKAKGYHYRFVFAQNAGHVDAAVIRQTLPETLLWLWRGYPIN